MKNIFLLVVIFLTACSHSAVKKDLSINELSIVMAYGTVKELNNIDPDIEKDLLIRLYQSPIFGESCFIETHGVCRNNYYISVSTFDEFPQSNVFKLKMVGEVTEIRWLQENKNDYVEIEFTINQYTKEALDNNSSLVNVQSKILVKLKPSSLVEIVEQ